MNRIPPPDPDAHTDGRLMHELTVVNTELCRYVLRFLDADAGEAEPITTTGERALADQVAAAADGIRARAARRDQPNGPRHLFDRQPGDR